MAGLFMRRYQLSEAAKAEGRRIKGKAEPKKQKKPRAEPTVKNTSRTEQIAESLRQSGVTEDELARLGYRRSR